MNARQADSLAAFQRALQCIARHPALRNRQVERPAVVDLQGFVDTIRRLAAKQKYAELRAKELTLAEDRVKHEVRLLLNQVSAVADGIMADGRRVFRAPTARSTAQDVILTCRAFAEAATPRAAEFIRLIMPTTFIADLLDSANALESAVADRVDIAAELRGATEGIKEAVSQGSKQLAVVGAIYGSLMTTEMRAEWARATRMGRQHRPTRAAPALALQPPPAIPEPIAIEAAPAQKALPVSRLESILVRLLRHRQPVEDPGPDASVSDIRRLPSKSSARL